MLLFDRIANALIARAARTPYFHLDGYMHRWWLVPFIKHGSQSHQGTGPVGWNRPIAKLLQAVGVAARVHEILRSDNDRAFHDHPWNYLTVILRGGYFEVRPVFNASGIYQGEERTWHGPGAVLYRPANSWHRLEIPTGKTATTLFITTKYRQKWGFMPEPARNKVAYDVYLNGEETT